MVILYCFLIMLKSIGEILYNLAKEKAKEMNKKVFFIAGYISAEERERIRQMMEQENNVVLIASFGTLSVGVNIKNLMCLIFAHPFKARIRTLQSIGRSLRKLEGKEKAILIDILDDLTYNKYNNFATKHATERLKIYEQEGFNIVYKSIEL